MGRIRKEKGKEPVKKKEKMYGNMGQTTRRLRMMTDFMLDEDL